VMIKNQKNVTAENLLLKKENTRELWVRECACVFIAYLRENRLSDVLCEPVIDLTLEWTPSVRINKGDFSAVD